MDAQRRFKALAEGIDVAAGRALSLGQSARLRTVRDALFLEEIQSSIRLAGSLLTTAELRGLLERGRALGEHRLSDYIIAAGYADAARYVAAQEAIAERKPRPYLRLEEVVELHLRATRGAPGEHPGRWRTTTLPASASGVVAPPPWKIAAEMRSFVDRIENGPAARMPPTLWASGALERLTRLQPFGTANGRVARLTLNLLLRRLGLPPFIVPRDRERYQSALQSAQAGQPWELAYLVTKSVADGLARLAETHEPSALELLAQIAPEHERAALYKAAQRGRLRTVRQGAHLYTTRAWLDAYTASRSPAGRKPQR
ncbi:MAG TPA: Fic family protein [Candidatus Acidoferrales bacterium]|nr:Fic family protein [Candidatus Acidoferrales bacterium]